MGQRIYRVSRSATQQTTAASSGRPGWGPTSSWALASLFASIGFRRGEEPITAIRTLEVVRGPATRLASALAMARKFQLYDRINDRLQP